MRCPKWGTFATYSSTSKNSKISIFTPNIIRLSDDLLHELYRVWAKNCYQHTTWRRLFFDQHALVKQIRQNAVFWSWLFTFYFIDALICENTVFGHWKILHELTSLSTLRHLWESLHFLIQLKVAWHENVAFVPLARKTPKIKFFEDIGLSNSQ